MTIASVARRAAGALAAAGYAAYAWLIFAVLAVSMFVLVGLLPRLGWRWRAARGVLQLLAPLTGTALTARGLDRLPAQSIVVANHPSWLDPAVLGALLPSTFRYIATGALERQLFAGIMLRRLDTQFVERGDEAGDTMTDTERLVAAVRTGRSVVIFPEGGLARRPGVRPFRMGAFVAATEAGVPVVPVGISGTRAILPPGTAFPRRGAIVVAMGRPLYPAGADWAAAVELQQRARAAVLGLTDEPDLE